jgi:hypothetical protein
MMTDRDNAYQTKRGKLPGHRYSDVLKEARREYAAIERRTRRNPYIRSAYFDKQKVFTNLFWQHIMDKRIPARKQRLRYFNCAVELIENTRQPPITKRNPNGRNELVHRFTGITAEGTVFYVQIKEELGSGRKYFMSAFPRKTSSR